MTGRMTEAPDADRLRQAEKKERFLHGAESWYPLATREALSRTDGQHRSFPTGGRQPPASLPHWGEKRYPWRLLGTMPIPEGPPAGDAWEGRA